MARPLRILGLHANDANWTTLSYSRSLPRAVARHSGFALTTINISKMSAIDKVLLISHLRFRKYDAIFLFHSVFSNSNYVSPALEAQIRHSRSPVVFFVGNEFKLMPEKMAFAERLELKLLITQISNPQVHDLYRRRLGCKVKFLPNATFDPEPFLKCKPANERSIDIGYRAFEGAWYLGHDDRSKIATIVSAPALRTGLRLDVSLDPARRMAAAEWHRFLGDCRAQLGTEAGTDTFELDDATRLSVNSFCDANPDTDFREIRERFFPNTKTLVSGRTLSSRHLEAAAARCVQILLPGTYAHVFKAGEHYLELARDGSNVSEILEKFTDRSLCERMTQAAFEASLERFSESRLMGELETEVRQIM